MKDDATLLKVEGLSKVFAAPGGWFTRAGRGVQAVDNVDLEIRRGETLALVGESGSGKSTTGKLVMRLLAAEHGSIVFDGRRVELDADPGLDFRKDVQIVFQDPRASLNPRRSIFKSLRDPLLLHKMAGRAEVRAEVARLLDRVGLSPAEQFIDRLPRQLSGGQLQRVSIARAISVRPKLIIADEAVSALDTSVRAQILELLRGLQQDDGLAFLFITHDLSVVRNIADRVAVMYLGRILEQGPVDEVFASPAHPYTKALLAATPIPDPKRARARRRVLLSGEIPSPADPPPGCHFHRRCPKVMDICSIERPDVFRQGSTMVACHLYAQPKPSDDAPAGERVAQGDEA